MKSWNVPTLRNESEEEERNVNSSIIIFLSFLTLHYITLHSPKGIIVNHNKDKSYIFINWNKNNISEKFLTELKHNKIIVNDI